MSVKLLTKCNVLHIASYFYLKAKCFLQYVSAEQMCYSLIKRQPQELKKKSN